MKIIVNPAQLLEEEINYNSKFIRYNIEQHWEERTIEESAEYLLDYIRVVNEEQADFMEEYFKSLSLEDLQDLLIEMVQKGIPIHQAPFWNNQNILDLKRIYEYTGAKRTKLKNIENTVIFGEEYFLVLRHTPESKFSARSIDMLSIKNLPVKSTMYKQYKALYSTTPIQIGEMEVIGLNLANPANDDSMLKVKQFLNAYANNEEDRMHMLEAELTGNPYDFDFEYSNSMSENSKIIRSFLTCLGYELK